MSKSPYGYPWADWLAREDPQYAAARQPVSELSVGEGKELSIKHREMVIIGILAFRGREDGVVAHMRRAVEHGATKDRKSTRLNSSHTVISYAVFCLKKKKKTKTTT